MNSFWDIVWFEYKKILMRRGVVVTLLLLTVFTVISPAMTLTGYVYVEGEPVETHYEAMIKDRAYERALAGRVVDETLFREMLDSYAKISPEEQDTAVAYQEREQYARPYSAVRRILNAVYRDQAWESLLALTDGELAGFYEHRREELEERVGRLAVSDGARAWLLEQDEELETPWVFEYLDGYHRFIVLSITTGVFIALALAICLAPLFAGEYASGASALLLSSKLGKNRLISAKLFTAVSFSAGLCILMMGASFLLSGAIFGLDGANAWIQADSSPYVPYPLQMWQVACLVMVCVLLACIFSSSITLLLSSRSKTPFGVIIIMTLLLVIPLLFGVSDTSVLAYDLYRLLPTQIMSIDALLSYVPYEFFGVYIPPYVFLPVFAAVVSAILLPLAWRRFRGHQVG
jgi:hypothetical protein